MKKFRRTLAMALVLIMVFAVLGPSGLLSADAYADEDSAEETVQEIAEETVKEAVEEAAAEAVEEAAAEAVEEAAAEAAEEAAAEIVEEIEQNENALTIVYNVVETKSKGSLYGELPTVPEGTEQQVGSDEDVTILDLDAHSYQTFTGNERDRFAYVSYAFKGWTTESGEIVTPGSEVAAESLDADGDGVAVLSSAWCGSWGSGSGTPFAKFSLWTNAMSANDCIESGTLLGENASSYTPSVGGSIMVALDDEGNTITPDELASPSHGSKGQNVGDIYNNPELSFKDNNQGKYLMVSYMGSSIIQADEDIRALASTGLHTSDSESGDVTWKLDSLPSDEEVLVKISSFVSRGMTTMRDENGKKIEAEALTTENYSVLWCHVKYQSSKNDGWNINGVLSTKVKSIQETVAKIIEAEAVETEPVETEPVGTEVAETEPAETESIETETVVTETDETEIAESKPVRTETVAPATVTPAKAVPGSLGKAASVALTPAASVNEAPEDAAPVEISSPAESSRAASLSSEHFVSLAAPIMVELAEEAIPMANPAPTAEAGGRSWAILNLLLLALVVYVFLPIFSLRNKAGRVHELAEGGRFAFAVEALLATIGLVAFLSTQDLRAPMIVADALTLPMAALAAAVSLIELGMHRAQSARSARA